METQITFPYRLSFDEAGFNSEMNRIRFAQQYAEKKMREISAINGMPITDHLFKDFMTNNGDAMAYALHQHVENKMQAAGLSSLRSTINAAQAEDRKKYLEIRRHHTSRPEAFYLKYEDGEVVIDEAKVNELRERHTVYLNDQKEYDLWQLHIRLVDTFNQMCDLAPRMEQVGISHIFNRDYTGQGRVSLGNLSYNWIAGNTAF